ncbi:MAG: pyridoxal phosphate-dependent aminotransferase [Myxococcota bacterium]
METSKRIQKIRTSATMALIGRAAMLKREGKDVKSFGAGEPDFDTPPHIARAASDAIAAGFTKYTPADGIPELKEAVAASIKSEYGKDAAPENVIITHGGKQALYNFFVAYLNPGDEVIIPAPYWVSYPEMATIADGTPIIVDTDEKHNFCLTAETLERSITKRTRALILNSPSNPSGAAYSEEALKEIANVLKDKEIVIVCDDIYHKIVYDGFVYRHLFQVAPELDDRILFVDGVAKAYSMTGFRIGWACGDKEIIAAMKKVSEQSTSCPTSVSQRAALAAITGDQSVCKTMVEAFDRRRKLIVGELNKIEGVSCRMPEGAFYAFPKVSGLIGARRNGRVIEDDFTLSEMLLEEKLIAVVPGGAFGAPGFLRFSYAAGEGTIKEGLSRFAEFVSELSLK